MLRVAIVGCGKIADQHVASIQSVADCEIVGVCDTEELMAKQLAERYGIGRHFGDLTRLLEETKPDIVHIATPGSSHLRLGALCLEAGCHIYVEKPFTLNTADAETLLKLAMVKGLKVTVGHNLQFSHAYVRMRQLIQNGYLGGEPIHMESYYCYDLSDERYARAMLGDRTHWIRELPGRLLHNLISHGIAKIAEFMTSENPLVIAHGFRSELLKKLGESDIIDELRVIVHDRDVKTAYFTFSTQMRPVLRHFRIYGPKNALIVDDDNQIVLTLRGLRYKSYLDQFIPPYVYARQHLANLRYNVGKFLRNDFHADSGMRRLVHSFYQSVMVGTPLPISYREILLTSKIMDSIFAQIYVGTDAV
jgi:predicted dehydrogenase